MASMNRLTTERRTQVIKALVEGNSIRATCRMTGTAKGTVLRLLAEVGGARSSASLRVLTRTQIKLYIIWLMAGRLSPTFSPPFSYSLL
jgi:hypothetical protein